MDARLGPPRAQGLAHRTSKRDLMDQDQILAMFRKSGALLEGHFRLTSGLHSDRYLQCALVLQHPAYAAELGEALATRLHKLAGIPDLVVAPALGGILVAHEVARSLGVRGLFAERQDGVLKLRRGFKIEAGERCFVVEDVVTTGGSTIKAIERARSEGMLVERVVVLMDRQEGGIEKIKDFVPDVVSIITKEELLSASHQKED